MPLAALCPPPSLCNMYFWLFVFLKVQTFWEKTKCEIGKIKNSPKFQTYKIKKKKNAIKIEGFKISAFFIFLFFKYMKNKKVEKNLCRS